MLTGSDLSGLLLGEVLQQLVLDLRDVDVLGLRDVGERLRLQLCLQVGRAQAEDLRQGIGHEPRPTHVVGSLAVKCLRTDRANGAVRGVECRAGVGGRRRGGVVAVGSLRDRVDC